MRGHAPFNNITKNTMPNVECGLDNFQWTDVFKLTQDVFTCSGIQIQINIKRETDSTIRNNSSNNKHYVKNEVENYKVEWTKERDELGTDFARASKTCQPPCTKQFLILRQKQINDILIDYYLPHQPPDIKNLKKQFHFRYTDLQDEHLVTLIDKIKDCRDVYSLHELDIHQTKQKIHAKWKSISELRKQRPSKCLLHLKDNLEKLLGQLQDSGIIRKMGDDDELGSFFVSLIIIMPKADYSELVIDTRHLNSITNLTNYQWLLEPVQMIMTRINGKYSTASDLPCAYNQVPQSPETQNMANFVMRGEQYTYHVGFYGLCGLPHWFSRMMTINFNHLIRNKSVITHIDDCLLQSQTKAELFTIIHDYHQLLCKGNLKAAPDETHFFCRKIKFLGHVISEQGIQLVAKTVKDLQNQKSTGSERDIMKILGSLGFFSCYIQNLHVDSHSFY